MKKINKIILLVGLIGSGKTSVGKRLAKKLSLPFIDGDQEIEKASGLSVIDVFKYFGLEEYRAGEERIMKRLLTGDPCIIASGGGSFVSEKTRKLAKNNALTIWLKADLDVLYSRTVGRKRRPFLQCTDSKIKSKLQTYIDEEYPYYNEANIIVETKNESVDNTVEKVFNAINNYVFQNEQEMYND
jgi:shikimate kinase